MFDYFSLTADEHAQSKHSHHCPLRVRNMPRVSPQYNRPLDVYLTTHAGGLPPRSTGSELALFSVANTLPKFRDHADQQSSSYQKEIRVT